MSKKLFIKDMFRANTQPRYSRNYRSFCNMTNFPSMPDFGDGMLDELQVQEEKEMRNIYSDIFQTDLSTYSKNNND